MKSNNFKTESCLDEYQNAINYKDFYKLYLYKRLHRDVLKKIISISLKNPLTFNVTYNFLNSIIKRNDIETLKLIYNIYLYYNDIETLN